MSLIRRIKKRFKESQFQSWQNYLIRRSRKNEIRKFRDPRRVEIFSKVNLSDEQKQAIDALFLENYGEKVPHTWHRHFTAFTGSFDAAYFPELLYIPEFERFMNMNREFAKLLTDKNFLGLVAAGVGVKMPKCYLTACEGGYRDANNRLISRDEALKQMSDLGEVFAKPTKDTSSGQGCFVANFENGVDKLSKRTVDEILDELGKNFAIQERLVCHESIRKIYAGSVNTFRIITYRWRDKIYATPAIMRIGQGGNYLDNAHAGGMFIAVNEDGTLHSTAFTEFKKEFKTHPDSGLKFDGYQIELFPRAFVAAKKMHEALPQLGTCNWDFTLDADGAPLLLEANTLGGSIWLIQMAHGRGGLGERTAEILRWIRMMKKARYSERLKYRFGYFPE